MDGSGTGRVRATEAALAAIDRLRARHGPLVFVQSGGCCDGSAPVCLAEGDILLGPDDVVIGELGGCAFHVDRELDARWNEPSFLIDVAPGGGDTFSLEGPEGIHFVARTSGREAGRRRPARLDGADPAPPE